MGIADVGNKFFAFGTIDEDCDLFGVNQPLGRGRRRRPDETYRRPHGRQDPMENTPCAY
jgi:hypothetical protein